MVFTVVKMYGHFFVDVILIKYTPFFSFNASACMLIFIGRYIFTWDGNI